MKHYNQEHRGPVESRSDNQSTPQAVLCEMQVDGSSSQPCTLGGTTYTDGGIYPIMHLGEMAYWYRSIGTELLELLEPLEAVYEEAQQTACGEPTPVLILVPPRLHGVLRENAKLAARDMFDAEQRWRDHHNAASNPGKP